MRRDRLEAELRRLAVPLRRRLGEVLASRERLTVAAKTAAYDLVTDADRSIEDWLFTEVHKAFPDDGFLGEEGGWRIGPTGAQDWVVDPIDGTVNLVSGVPWACCAIAVVRHGRPVAGLVLDPFRGDLYFTGPNGGSELNGTPTRVAPGADLAGKVVLLEVPSGWPIETLAPIASTVLERGGSTRSMGSGALATALVAAGRAQAVVHAGPAVWDIAAGVALVRHAGGAVVGNDGDYRCGAPGPLVAGSAACCDLLAHVLGRCELAEMRARTKQQAIESW